MLTMKKILALVILCCVFFLRCAQANSTVTPQLPAISQLSLQQLMQPVRHAQSVFFGGDIAASVNLSKGRVLWLFGDSLIGNSDYPKRFVRHMTHNSISLMALSHGQWQMKYYWRHHGFFIPANSHAFAWPMSGVIFHRHLLLLMNVYQKDKQFVFVDNELVLVENYQKTPSQWKWKWQKINVPKSIVLSDVVVDHGVLYAFAHQKRKPYELLFIDKNNCWRQVAVLKGLLSQPELSVVRRKKYWYTATLAYLSQHIHFYRSQQLMGPWHELRKTVTLTNEHKMLFAYAPKLHDFQTLLLTYNTNIKLTEASDELFNQLISGNTSLYVPQVLLAPVDK